MLASWTLIGDMEWIFILRAFHCDLCALWDLGANHHYYRKPGDCTCMHVVKKGRRLDNEKLFELKIGDIGMV